MTRSIIYLFRVGHYRSAVLYRRAYGVPARYARHRYRGRTTRTERMTLGVGEPLVLEKDWPFARRKPDLKRVRFQTQNAHWLFAVKTKQLTLCVQIMRCFHSRTERFLKRDVQPK